MSCPGSRKEGTRLEKNTLFIRKTPVYFALKHAHILHTITQKQNTYTQNWFPANVHVCCWYELCVWCAVHWGESLMFLLTPNDYLVNSFIWCHLWKTSMETRSWSFRRSNNHIPARWMGVIWNKEPTVFDRLTDRLSCVTSDHCSFICTTPWQTKHSNAIKAP